MTTAFWFALSAIIGGLLFRLVYERAEEIAIWMVKAQCRFIPSEQRAEIEAEQISVISEVKGDAWKLVNAIGFLSVSIPAGAHARKPIFASLSNYRRGEIRNAIEAAFKKRIREFAIELTLIFIISVLATLAYHQIKAFGPEPLRSFVEELVEKKTEW